MFSFCFTWRVLKSAVGHCTVNKWAISQQKFHWIYHIAFNQGPSVIWVPQPILLTLALHFSCFCWLQVFSVLQRQMHHFLIKPCHIESSWIALLQESGGFSMSFRDAFRCNYNVSSLHLGSVFHTLSLDRKFFFCNQSSSTYLLLAHFNLFHSLGKFSRLQINETFSYFCPRK